MISSFFNLLKTSSNHYDFQLSLVSGGFAIDQRPPVKFLAVHHTGHIWMNRFHYTFLSPAMEIHSDSWVIRNVSVAETISSSSTLKNHKCIPVRPIPALQCTTTGGPPGGPVQLVPKLWTAASLRWRTCSRKSNMAEALLGTPKSGQLT